ncbi:hypothetical protein KQI86_01405 [Clostridium sp. MSJ-11]|uniref:Lipoprotein n=1 Tax=Clostridium mobile TaxID=2841512 RepID=A0ABS6EDV2_9CLOT|nr:hypothetical protein [Clostridium mobile]MBU5482962.1 hypothetical protein [Clostridium mobile]
MSSIYKFISLVMTMLLALTASSCSRTNEEHFETKVTVTNFKFNDVIIMENKDVKSNIYKINNNSLAKVDSLEYVSEIAYKKDASLYILLLHDENEIKKNSINILKNDKVSNINEFYYAKDLRISPKGGNLAYRSYSSQSLDSAEGLSLYGIDTREKIQFNSSVLVSGNLFHWINDDEILYYGVCDETRTTAIYKYNVKDNKEEIYTKLPKGYYTYFLPYENNLMILSRDLNKNTIYLYERDSDKIISISESIEEIYDGVYNKMNNAMYIIGLEKGSDLPALYSINLENNKVERITFDFPVEADPYGGLKVDDEGSVYYCGYTGLDGQNNEVFKYNPKDNSNSLISINPSKYRIIGSN